MSTLLLVWAVALAVLTAGYAIVLVKVVGSAKKKGYADARAVILQPTNFLEDYQNALLRVSELEKELAQLSAESKRPVEIGSRYTGTYTAHKT